MKHAPDWEYSNDRAAGSLVMYTQRKCKICGSIEETIKTPYDSWFTKREWYKIKGANNETQSSSSAPSDR